METTENVAVNEDLRQSASYGRYMSKIGWEVEKVGEKTQMFVRKLGPVAIAKMQRAAWPADQSRLAQVWRKYRVMMCKLEPTLNSENPNKYGFRIDGWPLLATKTLRVSLAGSNEIIRDSFCKDARYCLRRAEGLAKQVTHDDFEQFYGIWKKAAKIKNLWIPGEKEFRSLVASFGKNAGCVTIDGTGGCLMLVHQNAAYYYYSGALPEAKKKRFSLLGCVGKHEGS